MPCNDSQYDGPMNRSSIAYRSDSDAQRAHIRFLEAALCGLIRSLPKKSGQVNQRTPFAGIDFDEAGISEKKLKLWWRMHQEQDMARAVREKKARDRARLRTRAIKKLTPSERAALGVSLANRKKDEDYE